MKAIFKLCAISLFSAGLATSACGSSDDSATATGGSGGSGGKGGSTAGGSSGKGGGTATAGSSGKGGSGTGGSAGATAGSSAAGTPGAAGEGGAGPSVPVFSEPPALGAQIDRLGRPGVNTALTDPFDIVFGKTEDAVKDAYNAEADPTNWSAEFKPYIMQNLAILDSLDSTSAVNGCGNQFAIGASSTSPNRYSPLANVLVDDRLYLNTASGTCNQYLGVEANAVGVTNTDCGGRTLTYNVIDTTYSVLAAGVLTGVTDGVAADGKTTATFPFLAAPQ